MAFTGTVTNLGAGYTTSALSGAVPAAITADNNTSSLLRHDASSFGGIFGWKTTFSPLNLSSGQIVIEFDASGLSQSRMETSALDGLFCVLLDGSGNYRSFVLGGSDYFSSVAGNRSLCVFAEGGITNTNGNYQSGTLNWSNITTIELYSTKISTGRLSVSILNIKYFAGVVGTGTINLSTYSEFLALSGYRISVLNNYLFPISFSVGNGVTTTNWAEILSVFQGLPVGSTTDLLYYYYGDANAISITFNTSSTDNLNLQRCIFKAPYPQKIVFTGATPASFAAPSLVSGFGEIDLGALPFESTNFLDCTTIDASASTLSGNTINGVDRVNLTSSSTFNFDYVNGPALTAGVIFSGAPGNYPGAIFFNNNAGTADFTIDPSSAGTFTFNNLSAASGYTAKFRNASATHDIVIATTISNYSTSTAGGGITIQGPSLAATFTGVPSSGIFAIWDNEDSDPQDFGTQLLEVNPTDGNNIAYPHSGGNAVIVQFLGTGYQELTYPITLETSSQTINLSELIEEEVNL